jgi:hypothetical protein
LASAGDLWSLSGPTNQRAMQSGNKSSQATGSESSNVSGSSNTSSFGFTSGTNTPQFALDALQQIIESFFPSNKISKEELDRRVPLPDRASSQYTTYRQDANGHLYPVYFNDRLYNFDLAAAQAKRNKLISQAGTNPGILAEGEANKAQLEGSIKQRKGDFSKDSAFADAGNLSSRYMRQLMETLMPQITRAVEASGTSGGAVSGLLAQDAASRVAESQAALGLQTAVQYGQISNQLDQLLAQLAATGNPELGQLIQLLGIAKGSIDERVNIGSQTTTENKSIDSNKSVNENTQQQGLVAPTIAPLNVTAGTLAAPVGSNVAIQRSNQDVESLLQALNVGSGSSSRATAYRF